MRDLKKYADECMRELDHLGIRYGKVEKFVVNTRAKTRLGLCKKQGDFFIIEISSVLLDERVDLKNGLKDTIMHELLHTCYGCMKHTGRWKALAAKVNQAYGYHISRASTPEQKVIPPELLSKPKYTVNCVDCGAVFERQRRSTLIDHPERYRCAGCGGRLILLLN